MSRLAAAWLVVLLSCCAWTVSTPGAAAQELASALNIAALAVDGPRLFVGTFDGGVLERAVDGSLHAVDSPLLADVNALVFDGSERALWVGTARGLVRCVVGVPSSCQRVAGGAAIHALLLLRDGGVLAGGDAGLLVVARTGERRLLDKKRGAPFRAVWSLAQGDDGVLFVGTTNGLFYGTLERWFDDPAGQARVGLITGDLPDDWVTALCVEQTTLHVGTYHAGLVAFGWREGKLVRQRSDPSLGYVNPGGLRTLDDGRLAVATMEGLRIGGEGAFRTLLTPERDVTALVRSGPGRYWVGTRAGLVSLSFAAPVREP